MWVNLNQIITVQFEIKQINNQVFNLVKYIVMPDV